MNYGSIQLPLKQRTQFQTENDRQTNKNEVNNVEEQT